jgi:hypothetical protein
VVVPDMFKDQYRFYDFDLYIKEIGYDDEYEYDDDREGDFYVTTEFDNSAKKYLHNQHTWWFHEINDYLKPEYKVVTTDLSESEDEFNVAAPPEWNEIELGIGDLITPENSTTGNYYLIKSIGGNHVWVRKGTLDYNGEFKPQHSVDFHTHLNILQSRMKPGFTITQNKNLNEVEDEFNVNAPEDWNVTELGVGDIITSNMFQTKEDVKFWMNSTDKLQILTIFKEYDEWIVVLGLPNTNERYVSWVIRNANKDLKPQYKIEQNLTESDDEFSVEAPSEWNIEQLSKGDIITPDMWDKKKTMGISNTEIKFDETYKISKVYTVEDWWDEGDQNWFPAYEAYLVDSQGVEAIDYLDNINMWLKPEFKVVKPLFESEEEFNVNAPKEWDVTELGVGDIITNDMWNPNTTKGKHFFDWIAFEEDGWEIIGIENDQAGDDRFYVTIMGVDSKLDFSDWLDKFNDYLKRQYKIADSLNESEDEFTVDAPESWNVTELGVGDYITPEMIDTPKDRRRWTSFHKVFGDPKRAPGWKIVEFVIDYVRLEHNGVKDIFSIKSLNKKIKPQFKIVPPTNETKLSSLLEQDDDFNVTAPTEWNIEYLSVGDIITPDMWQDKVEETFADFKQGKLFKKLITKPVKIDHVLEGDNIYFTVEGVDPVFTNDVLLPQYQVVKDKYVFESEDEFSVEAPKQWNVETLTVGDTITPDMWNKQKFINDGWFGEEGWFGLEAYNKTIQDSYLIQSMFFDEGDEDFEADWQVSLNSTTIGKSFNIMGDSTPLKILNNLLKDNYKVYSPKINESEDEFNVTAPTEWNVTELSKGDIITPDMWNDDINWTHDIRIEGFKPFSDENGYMIYLKHLDSSRFSMPQVFALSEVNSWLKNTYRVEVNGLMESDEDEFSVEAPPEWNQESLSTGDVITPNMWDKQKFINEPDLNGIKVYNEAIEDSWVIESIYYAEEDGTWFVFLKSSTADHKYFGLWSDPEELDNINNVLKDNYKIYISNTLLESDDEDDFSVDAPVEWNIETLTVGDTITPDMWDQSKLGRRKDYFEKPIKIDWIGYNEFDDEEVELLVGLNLGDLEVDYDINFINNLLKPEYKIVSPGLNESEDEFSVDAPSEWNAPDLKIGSIITPDMWDDEVKELSSINQFKIALTTPLTIKTIYPQNIGGSPGLLMGFTNGTYIHSSFLKPQYQIISNLSENDDEFTVDAPENWNVEELGIGSILDPSNLKMQDHSKKYEIVDFGVTLFPWENKKVKVKVFELVEEPIPGTRRTTRQWKHTRNSSIDLDTLKSRLKDNYKIISTLNESNDDEFNVDAPSEWSVEYLTVGDTVTSDMFQDLDQAKRSYGSSKKFKIIDIWVSTTGSLIVRLKASSWKLSDLLVNDDFLLKHFNEDLKPQYKVVPPNKIFESDDDEFSVEAPKSWDQHELKVGDYFNEYTEKVYTREEEIPENEKNFTYEVIYIGPNEGEYHKPAYFDHNIIVFKSLRTKNIFSFTVQHFNDTRGPILNAYINLPNKMSDLNESDDDWTVDEPSPEWNVEYLGVGDTIQGKMWNWKNIINWCNRVAGDNHVELNELIRRWEDVYDEGATIDRIVKYGDYHHVEFDSDSGFLRFGPNISTVNNWLSDGYEIEKSLTEEAEDFNVMASPKWDVIELGVGDYINSNMLNPKSNDYTWFSRRKFFIEDIYFDECWTVKLTHVESEHDEEMCVDFLNSDVLNNKYKIMTSLNELLEADDEFNVDAPKEWDVEELGIGDKITRDMIKNPVFLDQMDEDFRMDFPGVITKIYKAGPTDDDQYWGVRIKFQDVGWRKYLPQSERYKIRIRF